MSDDYVAGGVAKMIKRTAKTDVKVDERLQALFCSPDNDEQKKKKKKKNKRKSTDDTESDANAKSPSAKKQRKSSAPPGETATPTGTSKTPKKLKAKKIKTKINKKIAPAKTVVDGMRKREEAEVEKGDVAEGGKAAKWKSDSQEKLRRTVFVGNVPNTLLKKEVLSMFRVCGPVESVRFRSAAPANLKYSKKTIVIKKDFHKERHNINVYVVFKDVESTKKALALNGKDVDGLHLRIDLATRCQEHNHRLSVFVGNLPFDAREDALREHFSECGEIQNVRLVRDVTTGLGKGFGYILFEETSAVSLAMAMVGSLFNSRKLRIEKSTQNLARKSTKRDAKAAAGQRPKLVPKSTAVRRKHGDTTATTKAAKMAAKAKTTAKTTAKHVDRTDRRRRTMGRPSTATSMAARGTGGGAGMRVKLKKLKRQKERQKKQKSG